MLKEYPEAEFHIAGRNAPPSFKHKLNKKNIIFHGSVDDAHEFVQQYNIMVSPLLTGSGMRVKLVESMALQKPIVSTRFALNNGHRGNGTLFVKNLRHSNFFT